MAAAYAAHPERFPRGLPTPGTLPAAVWINKPVRCACAKQNALPGSARSDDLERPRDSSTPEPGVTEATEEELVLVTAQ